MKDEEITNEDQKTIDDAKVEAAAAHEKVLEHAEENLAALRDDDYKPTEEELKSDEYHPTPDELRDKATSEQSDQKQDESTSEQSEKTEQTDDAEESSEKTEQTDDTSDSKAGDENALTEAEVRAAIHNGWSQDDIDELVEANPGLAKKTCTKALESQNNLSAKFSELGKTQAAKSIESAVPVTPVPDPKPKLIDFTALEKEYENDPIVGVLKQVVEQSQTQAAEISTLREISPRADAAVDAAQVAQDAATTQQIDTFFGRPDVAAFKDVYGEVEKDSKDWDTLTRGQIKKRYEVAEQANLIMLGHQKLHENDPNAEPMPLDEAFERAHFLVTKDVQEAAMRKTIKAKAVKRSKSLTLEPTDSKKVPGTGQKTKAEIEANAARGLQKLRS